MNTFRISDTVDAERFDEIVSGLRSFLDMLCSHQADAVFCGDIKIFCESLVAGQSGELSAAGARLAPGSWCVSPSIEGMPSDARVDYIFVPTYLAVSILVKVKTCQPDIALGIPRFEDSLRAGLDFAALRKFMGHGYDAMSGLFEAAEIMHAGGVFGFVRENPYVSPAFCSAVSKTKADLEARLASGDVSDGFDQRDVSAGMRRALRQISAS